MTRFQVDNTQSKKENILLVGVDFHHSNSDFAENIAEAQSLVQAVSGILCRTECCKRDKPDGRLFIGSGKADEMAHIVRAHSIDVVIFNHPLTPTQERNLEQVLQCRVIDRIGLILDIFARRARTPEGCLQVEWAQLKHLSSRLVRGYGHLKSQKGGIGLKGPGETQLETDRRLISQKMGRLQKRLKEIRQQRATQRKNRDRKTMPTFALVGYTNVGKSTLFNRLTGSHVTVADQLFATLDTTARHLYLAEDARILLTDTVGFIRDLPHELIEAFSATLEETAQADILLHTVDASHPAHPEQIERVQNVLHEIGAAHIPQILLYNQIDKIGGKAEILRDNIGQIRAVRLSAIDNATLPILREALIETTRHWYNSRPSF